MGPFFIAIQNAHAPEDVLEATREFLASWTPELARRLRDVDGGWAPFDDRGNPLSIDQPLDVLWFYEAISSLRLTLERRDDEEGGVGPVPRELIALEQFLAEAAAKLKALSLIQRLQSLAGLPGMR